jgi:DNA repair protein RadC
MNEKLNITQWAEEDRPREKMLLHGPAALSNAELLAILIGSGNTEETAVELMRKVLDDCHNRLSELGKYTVDDLCRYKGIGPAKAVSILAARAMIQISSKIKKSWTSRRGCTMKNSSRAKPKPSASASMKVLQ